MQSNVHSRNAKELAQAMRELGRAWTNIRRCMSESVSPYVISASNI
jgi:hypothetical protein